MRQPLPQDRLPIGVQTFREIRNGNHCYVDKTHFALRLFSGGSHYFLSRPPRFGKSLFLSTLTELFEGRRELFEGLAAYDRWDWSVRRPVVRLDFSDVTATLPGQLEVAVDDQLRRMEDAYYVERRDVMPSERLDHVIRTVRARSGRRAVFLVDGYEKPVIDARRKPDLAWENSRLLDSLYSVVKGCDDCLRFSLITGVRKFFRFSPLYSANCLNHITRDARYSSICGYTERDLDTVFAPALEGLDRGEIRAWYKAYSWGGKEKLYHPSDLLLLLRGRKFRPGWWSETAMPRHLRDSLARPSASFGALENLRASDSALNAFGGDDLSD